MAVRLRVMIVRHGESENNVLSALGRAEYVTKRTPDPNLTQTGKLQAETVGKLLADPEMSALIQPVHELRVSPVKRTLQTMQPVAEAVGLRPKVWDLVYETGGLFIVTNGAAWSEFDSVGGLTRSEMERDFPNYELPSSVTEKGWYTGNEMSNPHVLSRQRGLKAAAELKQLAADLQQCHNMVLVIHHDFICALLDGLLFPDTPLTESTGNGRWTHYNCATSVVDIFPDGNVKILQVNSTTHIDRDLVAYAELGIR